MNKINYQILCILLDYIYIRKLIHGPYSIRYFSLFLNVQPGPVTHTASYSMGTGFFARYYDHRSLNLTIHPRLIPRLRMSEGVTLLPLCAFMAFTGQCVSAFALLDGSLSVLVSSTRCGTT